MVNLAHFTVSDVLACGSVLRSIAGGAQSMEDAASRITSYLYEQIVDAESNEYACALIRFYKTHPFGDLNIMLRGFARAMSDDQLTPTTKCLVLMATRGVLPSWNSRKESVRHQAIPLPSSEAITQSPMIAQLIAQFGIDVSDFLKPDLAFLVDKQKTYNVFYVPNALDNPVIPAQQDFVVPMGIKSVLGFGGLLPSGQLFAIVLFSKVFIPRETAELFKSLVLSIRGALLPFDDGKLFS